MLLLFRVTTDRLVVFARTWEDGNAQVLPLQELPRVNLFAGVCFDVYVLGCWWPRDRSYCLNKMIVMVMPGLPINNPG